MTLAAAFGLGLAATIFALQGDPGFNAVKLGPWLLWPRLGSADIDPYARAWLALDGAAPLGAGEGLSFVAREDQNGAKLDSRCDYIIAGATPSARVWTLTAYDVNGRLRPNPAGRYGLISTRLLRSGDGAFVIEAAREARPGNWLPLGQKSRFVLIFRAYDANASATTSGFEGLAMPSITRGACS